MKHLKLLNIGLYAMTLNVFFTTACINHVSEEEEPLTPSDLPIRISTQILCTTTRIAGNEFEDNDAIGLYVLAQPQTIAQQRYVNNMRFTCNYPDFIPDEKIYYPAGNVKCDFISYYPYQTTGFKEGEDKIDITIQADQSTSAHYSSSDFLVAKASAITPSKSAVELKHNHKLCQLNIVIQPTEGEDINNLLTSSPTITINQVCTKATYHLEENSFTELEVKQDLIPHGEWEIVDDKLVGKIAILIPQTIQKEHELLTLRVNGKSYPCLLPADLVMESNKTCKLLLSFNSQVGIGRVVPSIDDWTEGNKMEITPGEGKEGDEILMTDFDFDQSHAYNIIYQNKPIAEVCKEYLLAKNIDAQAIVIYPVIDGVSDLSNGTVLQILNQSNSIHGGSVCWDKQDHSLTYVTGTNNLISCFYIDSDYSITFSKPEGALTTFIQKKTLLDKRGTKTTEYPIVKIGTQYWMGSDLKATTYNDGSSIPFKTDLTKTNSGYFFIEPSYYFYNRTIVTNSALAPLGWKIPNETEWNQLKSYIDNNAVVLKAGNTWETHADARDATNLSGFNGQPTGFFSKKTGGEESIYSTEFSKKYVGYWSIGNTSETLAEQGPCLKFDSNTIGTVKQTEYCGYCVRCIQE